MEEKDFTALMEKVTASVRDTVKLEMQATIDGVVKADDLTEKFEALGLKENVITELTEAVEKQGIELRKFFDGKEEKLTLSEQLNKMADDIRKIAIGDARSHSFTLKTDVTRASITDSTIAMRLPGVGQIQTQRNVISGLFRQGTIGANQGGVIRYMDQASRTNNAAAVAEGGQKPESAITWVEKTLDLQKVADSIPVSQEAFTDIDFIRSEVERLLNVNLSIVEDTALWSGSGVAPNVKGIYTYADTYSAGASGISDANIYDLIVKMQENINKDTHYDARVAVMNIVDVNKMKLKKDANNNYILPPFVSTDGKVVNGCTVVVSSSVTANTMLVGDFDFSTLYRMGGIEIKMGWIDDQFIKNTSTILAEYREALLVRSVDTGAFNKCTDIAAALITLAS